MKVLLQRVSAAAVEIDRLETGRIGAGLVVLVGVAAGDDEEDIGYLVSKLLNLRIFGDADGKFNLSIVETGGELLIVSQFTLLADTRRGRRPGFTAAAPPAEAARLFERFLDRVRESGLTVASGRFQAHMLVEIHNDGPVTIMLDSRDRNNLKGTSIRGSQDGSD